ncbi:hypothetical protein Tco_1092515 [Tanacetum coccineum]|uniref:Uncharacterized protein n=1 Tax=Tanacetum coccineum TaxID=301880 RepID=A0ABQ5ICH5_9ASTR
MAEVVPRFLESGISYVSPREMFCCFVFVTPCTHLGEYVISLDVSYISKMILKVLASFKISSESPFPRDEDGYPGRGFEYLIECPRVDVSSGSRIEVRPSAPNHYQELSDCTLKVLNRYYSCVSGSYPRLRHPSSTVMEVKKPKVAPCLGIPALPCDGLVIELAGWSCPCEAYLEKKHDKIATLHDKGLKNLLQAVETASGFHATSSGLQSDGVRT